LVNEKKAKNDAEILISVLTNKLNKEVIDKSLLEENISETTNDLTRALEAKEESEDKYK
jgi:hypothetical protein